MVENVRNEDKVSVFGRKESCKKSEVHSTDQYLDYFQKGATQIQQALAISKTTPQADTENYNKSNSIIQVEKQTLPFSFTYIGQKEQQKYLNPVCSNKDELESRGCLVKPENFGGNTSCCCRRQYWRRSPTTRSDVDITGRTLASTSTYSGELGEKNSDRIRGQNIVVLVESSCEANQIQSHQNSSSSSNSNITAISKSNNKFRRVNHLKPRESLQLRHLNTLKLQPRAHLMKLLQKYHNNNQEFAAKTENKTTKFTRSTSGKAFQMLVWMLTLAILANSFSVAESVDCFKCSSRNGSNPACEDPFHNLNTTKITSPFMPDPAPSVIYHTPCYAGKKGREGLFPASACIKLTGTFARMSHCGKFQFEGDLLKGCVLACPEDACNSTQSNRILSGLPLSFLISALAPILAYYLVATPGLSNN